MTSPSSPFVLKNATSSISLSSSSNVSPSSSSSSLMGDTKEDAMLKRLQNEANEICDSEPELSCLLHRTVLHPQATTFEKAVAISVSHRLSTFMSNGSNKYGGSGGETQPDVCPNLLKNIFLSALSSEEDGDDEWKEAGHTTSTSLRQDALAYLRRDPACDTLLEPLLFFKGYAAVVCHRVSYKKWHQHKQLNKSRKSFISLWIQSQASAAFGVDIHPAATIGCGFMMDHATGIVVGETATIGDGCTILHGVTLGGTGKEKGRDRHPKIGHHVLIGAGTQVLGNIKVGDGAKIGAGSVVLRPVPHGTTAVGVPAKVVGWAKEKRPGSSVDMRLLDVVTAVGGGNRRRNEGGENEEEDTSGDDDDDDENQQDNTTSTVSLTTLASSSSAEHIPTITEDEEDEIDPDKDFSKANANALYHHKRNDTDEKEKVLSLKEHHGHNENIKSKDKPLSVSITATSVPSDRKEEEAQERNQITNETKSKQTRRRSYSEDLTSTSPLYSKFESSNEKTTTTETTISSTSYEDDEEENNNSMFVSTKTSKQRKSRSHSVGDADDIEDDICCPYRDFFCSSAHSSNVSLNAGGLDEIKAHKNAGLVVSPSTKKKKNSMTFPTLHRFLKKEGATNYEIGETFMELLKRDYYSVRTTIAADTTKNSDSTLADQNTTKRRNSSNDKCGMSRMIQTQQKKKKREGNVKYDVFVNEFVSVAEEYTRIKRERLDVLLREMTQL